MKLLMLILQIFFCIAIDWVKGWHGQDTPFHLTRRPKGWRGRDLDTKRFNQVEKEGKGSGLGSLSDTIVDEDFVNMFSAKKPNKSGKLSGKEVRSESSSSALDISFKEREYNSFNSPGALNAVLESKAELLRLEATQEQSLIDAQLLKKELDDLIQRDLVLLEICDGKLQIGPDLCRDFPVLLCADTFFRIAELVNTASTLSEKDKFTGYFNDLMETTKKFDTNLHANIQADIEKELMKNQNALIQSSNQKGNKKSATNKSSDNNSDPNPAKIYGENDDAIVKGWIDQLNENKDRDDSGNSKK